MSGGALADSALLVIAVAALLFTADRLAAQLADEPLPRLITTFVFTAAAAVAQALILGLFGIGGSPGPLTGLAVLSALATWRLVPTPEARLTGGVLARVRAAGPLALVAGGAAGGAILGLAVAQLHRPLLGQDAVTYHLPEVINFVQSGHPGRVFNDFYGLPVGNYPITEEVLLAWFTGISHGFAALMLVTIATVPLLILAGWQVMAELEVPAPIRVLALMALIFAPLIAQAWVQPGTDLQAMTWLVCCTALCLAARRHPGLLAPAIVAAGLAIGTKTTVASWSVIVLIVALWFRRGALRSHWRPLLAAVVVAAGTGLVWYLRNWADHGSPLWPFSSFPGGDPRPQLIDYLSTSLLKSLHRTLLDHLHAYTYALSGGVVLILGGIITGALGLAARRRRVVIAAVATLLGALEYAAGPVTGLPPHGLALVGVIGSTLRYLMPVFAAGALALALTAADRAPALRGLGLLGLFGALVWDLVIDLPQTFYLPSATWIWVGAIVGAALLFVVGRLLGAGRLSAPRRSVLAVGSLLAAVITALVLAVGSTHFSYRHAATADFAQGVSDFLNTQPLYTRGDTPVSTSGTGLAQLAGDRLQHRIAVIPQTASCQRVYESRFHGGWLVVEVPQAGTSTGVLSHVVQNGTAAACMFKLRATLKPVYDNGQYAVYAPAGGWWSYPPLSSIQYSPAAP